ncbi:PREDICTED: LYR motif-containing protein 4-like isoform X2 [Acropora digitifera]|uniref:LYR motif-containing protein 4-like isoform X2 n=1 Tax=Acropora digitifera TaxID=70779 RepID=UPI00077A1941|nr:PREDICTED: LYR motif-containing protein 4-like isoform X2 [Acropora digitifera]
MRVTLHMAAVKMATAREVLQLYRQMLRVGKSFSSYNYRMYATRRIKDAFKENKNITDPEKIKSLIMKAQDSLEIMKRQVFLGQMYRHSKLVIEKK